MSGIAVATSTALVPAIIAAIASLASAVILAWVALRAQSAKGQLEEIRKIVRENRDLSQDHIDIVSKEGMAEVKRELREILDARSRGYWIADIVKRELRDVLREEGLVDGRRSDR